MVKEISKYSYIGAMEQPDEIRVFMPAGLHPLRLAGHEMHRSHCSKLCTLERPSPQLGLSLLRLGAKLKTIVGYIADLITNVHIFSTLFKGRLKY